MLQLDNVTTTANYDDCSIASESGSHVVYLIANNSARMQVRGLFDMSLGNTPDWTPPEGMLVAPTTAVIDKCSGIRFKTVVPGKPAQIIAQLMEPKDVLPQSGTPFTQQLSQGGAVSGVVELASLTALLVANAPQSIPNGILTRILIDTLETVIDPNSDFTFGGNHIVTNFAGVVLVSGFTTGGGGAGDREVLIERNGFEFARGYTPGGLSDPTTAQIVPCAVGDTYDLWFFQTSGVAQNVTGARLGIARLA